MTVYARQIATAKRLIAAKGRTVAWKQIPNGTPEVDSVTNAETPWLVDSLPPKLHLVKMVLLPYTRINSELIKVLSGTEIEVGQVYGLMASVVFTPSRVDTVIAGTDELRIDSIEVLQPDGTPILYTINFKI